MLSNLSQQAPAGMLQNQLGTVQRYIQEPCHIQGRSFCDNSKQKLTKLSLLFQKVYFRCSKVSGSVFDIVTAEMSRIIVTEYDYRKSWQISSNKALLEFDLASSDFRLSS